MAMEKIALVGLEGLENRAPSELSGGQQQRVAVARALVLEPQVLLFDEPLSNLDAKLRRRVREEIRELQLSLGLTVAYVTHDQEEALAVSDRIIVMSNARIAQIGAPRELYDAPASRFVADFMGDANLIPVGWRLMKDHARRSLSGGARSGSRIAASHREALMWRSGRITIALVPGAGSDGDLEGRISKAAYVGDHMEYRIALGEPRLELFAIARRCGRPSAERQRSGRELRSGRAGPRFRPIEDRP